MIDNLTYKVVEDNTGGLHLFVFEDNAPIWSASQLERSHSHNTLSDTIISLVYGGHPINNGDWEGWEGWKGDDNPQKDWEWFNNQASFNWNIIMEGDAKGSTININIMDYPSLVDLISIPLK